MGFKHNSRKLNKKNKKKTSKNVGGGSNSESNNFALKNNNNNLKAFQQPLRAPLPGEKAAARGQAEEPSLKRQKTNCDNKNNDGDSIASTLIEVHERIRETLTPTNNSYTESQNNNTQLNATLNDIIISKPESRGASQPITNHEYIESVENLNYDPEMQKVFNSFQSHLLSMYANQLIYIEDKMKQDEAKSAADQRSVQERSDFNTAILEATSKTNKELQDEINEKFNNRYTFVLEFQRGINQAQQSMNEIFQLLETEEMTPNDEVKVPFFTIIHQILSKLINYNVFAKDGSVIANKCDLNAIANNISLVMAADISQRIKKKASQRNDLNFSPQNLKCEITEIIKNVIPKYETKKIYIEESIVTFTLNVDSTNQLVSFVVSCIIHANNYLGKVYNFRSTTSTAQEETKSILKDIQNYYVSSLSSVKNITNRPIPYLVDVSYRLSSLVLEMTGKGIFLPSFDGFISSLLVNDELMGKCVVLIQTKIASFFKSIHDSIKEKMMSITKRPEYVQLVSSVLSEQSLNKKKGEFDIEVSRENYNIILEKYNMLLNSEGTNYIHQLENEYQQHKNMPLSLPFGGKNYKNSLKLKKKYRNKKHKKTAKKQKKQRKI